MFKHLIYHTVMIILSINLFFYSSTQAQDIQEETPTVENLSETQTVYNGAHLLSHQEEINLGEVGAGVYNDESNRERYHFWQGDSLFLGVISEDTENRLDAVAEFYWFESSLPRNSDFYVIILKVTASPIPNTYWRIATPESIFDELILRDIGAVHRVQASLNRSGNQGAIRWDWSIPFQNYRWEPERVIEVEQEYAVGVNAEGSTMKDLSLGANVQAKGFIDATTKVSTRYTITLWRWEMLVQAGATDLEWNLVALSPEHEQDPAYHEYFLVLQSERGVPVQLNHLQFATTMRERRPILPDEFENLSIRLSNIILSPPTNPCPPTMELTANGCLPICEQGYELQGSECVSICPLNTRLVNGACVEICEDGSLSIEGECAMELECPDGQINNDGICVSLCESNEIWQTDRCIDLCPARSVWQGDECVCEQGYHLQEGLCIQLCQDDKIFDGSTCVNRCEDQYHYNGSICIRTCPEGTYLVDEHCVSNNPSCDPGYELINHRCQPLCLAGEILSNGLCTSVCPEGFRYTSQGCVSSCPDGTHYIEGICRENPCDPSQESCIQSEQSDQSTPLLKQDKEGCQSILNETSQTLCLFLILIFMCYRRRNSSDLSDLG
jgi:hypothetical protein